MDAPASSPDSVSELRELRRRAYGPEPDIAQDPLAMDRLAALERDARQSRHPQSDEPGEEPRDAAALAGPNLQDAPDDRVGFGPDRVAPEAGSGRVRRVRRRRAWAIALAAVVLAAAGAWWTTALLAPRGDVVLRPIPSSDAQQQALGRQGIGAVYDIDRTTLQQFDPYGQLRVWSGSTENGNRCLVLETDAYGIYGITCAPRELEPTLDLYMFPGVSDDISGGLPMGSVVRFVLESGGVTVQIAAADVAA